MRSPTRSMSGVTRNGLLSLLHGRDDGDAATWGGKPCVELDAIDRPG
jgi:hypothetical protein